MEIFAKEIALTKEEEEFSAYHLLHILSAILNYEEQLEHLDQLIVSIQQAPQDMKSMSNLKRKFINLLESRSMD